MPIDSREGRTRRGETVFSVPMGQLVLVVVSHHNHGPPNPTGRVSPAIIAGVILSMSNGLAPLARQVLLPWPFPIQRPRVTGDGMTVVDDTNPQDATDDSMVLVTMEDAGNIMLTGMADWFRAEGLAVIEEPDWDARGVPWAPSGGMIHHTGPPVPFAVEALYPAPHGTLGGGRIKANFNVKPDGTVHVIAAGACTYASGPGNTTTVLKETRLNIAPSGTASTRRLGDTGGGNRHFVNCEADHLGDGSIMTAVQERAVIKAYNAIFRNFGWPAARLVGHCEWTTRKVDPRWNGTTNRTPHLRAEIGKLEA